MDRIDNKNEEILIKVDQNNLIYIDPNSVVDEKGLVYPRNLNQEKLVMYANLEADLVPRSNLVAANDKNTLTSIARGTLNFLKNQEGGDYDTNWTESYLPFDESTVKDKNGNFVVPNNFKNSDTTGQSFGIDTIKVDVKGANSIPQVQINFIDVRGKTLFESPENSPYRAFFHVPWPIFYLTLKGYYGKAIRYRLHLVKFTSKFNEANGNFEVQTTFVGSTYAYLSDIPLQGILNAPYMFIKDVVSDKVFNPNTQIYDQKASKSSKGYSILRSVYSEYKAKGFLSENFPVKTLRELIITSQSLDKILEQEIFGNYVDMTIFSALKGFETDLTNFEKEVKSWAGKNLDKTSGLSLENSDEEDSNVFYPLKQNKKSLDLVTGDTKNGALEQLIELYTNKLKKNNLLTSSVINKTSSVFTNNTMKLNNKIQSIDDYYKTTQNDGSVYVGINKLVNDIRDVNRSFNEQKDKLEKDVESKMNEIVKDPTKGIGFEPTIRNIFAVILANTDTYIRLHKDVHQRTIDVGNERKKVIKGFTDETPGEPIYPWPEIKKNSEKSKQKIIAYPGATDLKNKLKSYDSKLWPEVEFVENFISVATQKDDPSSEESNGGVNFIFESDLDTTKIGGINTLLTLSKTLPYIDKTQAGFLYEMWERNFNTLIFESFNNEMIKRLANIEYESIQESIKEDQDIIKLLIRKARSFDNLKTALKEIAPLEKYTYYEDQLPSTQYIRELVSNPYNLEQYEPKPQSVKLNNDYDRFNKELENFSIENYRYNMFPFNASNYLKYVDDILLISKEFRYNFNNYYSTNLSQGFISGVIDPNLWVNGDYFKQNIFGRGLSFEDTTVNILNTPYFHNQLYSDFACDSNITGKYAGSAYLFLNSLPFVDLETKFDYTLSNGKKIEDLTVSHVFKELSASHYLPYHLILKWGSIYHRYKKYLKEGIDILGEYVPQQRIGFIDSNNNVIPVDDDLFFNNYDTQTFTISGYSVNNTSKDVGIYPFYQAIYSQIVNGYNHYEVLSGATSYTGNTTDGAILHNLRFGTLNELRYWTILTDNEKFGGDKTYTLLPCDGGNEYFDLKNSPTLINNADTLSRGKQIYHRLLWSDNDYINNDFSGKTFSSHSEYQRSFVGSGATTDDRFEMTKNYRKVYDLIATFSPKILDEFETMFLEFSSDKVQQNVQVINFNKVQYYKFQDILKAISNIEKKSEDDGLTLPELFTELRRRQGQKLEYITKKILSNDNLIKLTLGNSKEYDTYVLHGFTKISSTNRFSVKPYLSSQLTTQNQKLIKLYIGENPESQLATNLYENFFLTNNVELNEENILTFRPLIYLYAGFVLEKIKSDGTYVPNNSDFVNYLKENIFEKTSDDKPFNSKGFNQKVELFFTTLTNNFKKLREKREEDVTIIGGYNNDPLKIELYNTFKSFNDKWIAGNSIGQRILIDEFLFLDRANRDIGDRYYFNLDKIATLDDKKNAKQSLYGLISILLNGTGFDMRPLPAYINFYGTNFSSKPKLTPSKKVAENIFGTFLDVDYQESSPKVIIQYIGNTSKRPDMSSEKYNFTDDSFNVANTNNNPILITTPQVFTIGELSKSNKAVAFEISFGDQNQSIFKTIQLDQSSIKNTSESFVVLENLGRSESGAGTHNVDVSLYDYYKTASYTCSVTCMGNVMIQPTMFFYLKNVPMFRGTYWITEVSHNIRNNNIVTSFKGTRIPYTNLPDPKDSFLSSYRIFFDKLLKKAVSRVEANSKTELTTAKNITVDGINYTVDIIKELPNETFVTKSSLTPYGVPFNGFNNERYIQMVKHDNEEDWLRASVVMMGGPNYSIAPNTQMALINRLTETSPFTIIKPKQLLWSDVQNSGKMVYSTKFKLGGVVTANNILGMNTKFYNPQNRKSYTLVSDFQLDEDAGVRRFQGPIDIGPTGTYGISMSKELMYELGLDDGNIVYFKLV